jgi:hypothetical protein
MSRVLDGLTVFVACGAAVIAVAMIASVVVATAGPGGARAGAAPTAEAFGRTASPSGSVTAASVPSPPPLPSANPTEASPIVAASYRSGGHTYAGLEVRPGTVVTAAFDGLVEVRMYQLIDGGVRVGSNVPSLPFYPYVTVVSVDRRMTYRPGALGSDVEVLVEDGQHIPIGAPLFRQLGAGRSSWAAFYDPGSPFQVVVSVQAVPSGLDLDPLSLF